MVNTCPNLLAWLKICALKNYPTVLISGKLPVSSPPVLPTLEVEDPLVFVSLPYNLGLSFSSSSSPSSPESASLTHNLRVLHAIQCHSMLLCLLPPSPLPTLDLWCLSPSSISLCSHHYPFCEDVHFLHSLSLFLPYSPLTWSSDGLQTPDTG